MFRAIRWMLFNNIEGFNINNIIDKVKIDIIKLWAFVTDKLGFTPAVLLFVILTLSKCITLIICR